MINMLFINIYINIQSKESQNLKYVLVVEYNDVMLKTRL